jgi:hypothetical protein
VGEPAAGVFILSGIAGGGRGRAAAGANFFHRAGRASCRGVVRMQGRVRLDRERGPDAGSHSYEGKGASCRVAKNIRWGSQLHGHVQTGRSQQQGRSTLYKRGG